MRILLRHEKLTHGCKDHALLKQYATMAFKLIKVKCVCVNKQCNSHVYLGQRDQRKNMTHAHPEMKLWKEHIDLMNPRIASTIGCLPRLADTITQ